MAYATGTAASPDALLSAIRSFAIASCGFTENLYAADAGFNRLHLAHASSGQFVDLHSFSTTLNLRASAGFNSGSAWNAQPNQSTTEYLITPGTSAEYHLFGGAGWLHCVVSPAVSSWVWIGFGAGVKYGTWTGGNFFGANSSGGVGYTFRCDIDGQTNRWVTDGFNGHSMYFAPALMPWNAVSTLFPVLLYSTRLDVGGGNVELGELPGVLTLNMTGFAQRDEITIGADVWKVFATTNGSALNYLAWKK